MPEYITAASQHGDATERAKRLRIIAKQRVENAINQLYRTRPHVIPVSAIQDFLDHQSGYRFEGRTVGVALKDLGYIRHPVRLPHTTEDKTQTPIYISDDQIKLLESTMPQIKTYMFTEESFKFLRYKTQDYYNSTYQPKRESSDDPEDVRTRRAL